MSLALIGALLLAGGLLASPGPVAAGEAVRLNLGASPPGGGWYPLMGVIAEALKKEFPGAVTTVGTSGGRANVALIGDGKLDLGLSSGTLASAAYQGREPYKKAYKNVLSLMVFDVINPLHMLVVKEAGVATMEDMKARKPPLRIATDQPGSTGFMVVRDALAFYGLTLKDFETWGGKIFYVPRGEVVSLIRDGHANAYFAHLATPASVVLELATVKELNWIGLSQDAIERGRKLGYVPGIIKAGIYPKVTRDVRQIGDTQAILVRSELPKELVYRIAKAIVDNAAQIGALGMSARFNPKEMWKEISSPLHPGAEAFYKEKGLMPR
ncbi:MAG: TAXI family TRAP transporter solute-binding subunit [Deltaproteobacteria bacterium]|nr:TAXI family TRAP transporter solute-binding subunit [Deltaproteobacteria bacterium]